MRLNEIRKRYDAENDTLEEIKKKLKSILREIHPDNNRGNYDKDYFKKINEDLEYIEEAISKENSKKEIKFSPSDLLNVIQELNYIETYSKNNTENRLQKKFDESVQEQLVKCTNQFKIKRYSLTGVTTLLTFLWMIPDRLLEHPILKHLFNGDRYLWFIFTLSFVWGILLIVTILYWLLTLKIENMEKEILENIKIESVQNEFIMNYIVVRKDKGSFSKKEFMQYILFEITYKFKNNKLRKIVQTSISEKVLQDIADIILERAEAHKIVKKVEKHSLIEHFEIIKE